MGHYAYFCDRIRKQFCLFLIAGFSLLRVSFSLPPFLFSFSPCFLFLPFFSLPPFLFSSYLSFLFLLFFSLPPFIFSSSLSFFFLPFFLFLPFFSLPPLLFSSFLSFLYASPYTLRLIRYGNTNPIKMPLYLSCPLVWTVVDKKIFSLLQDCGFPFLLDIYPLFISRKKSTLN